MTRGSYEREWPGPIPEVKKICIDQKIFENLFEKIAGVLEDFYPDSGL